MKVPVLKTNKKKNNTKKNPQIRQSSVMKQPSIEEDAI